jgi:hypothetical protein
MTDLDDVNQPVMDITFDSKQIQDHNNFCQKLRDELKNEMKTTNFKYQPKEKQPNVENPLLTQIFFGKGLKKENTTENVKINEISPEKEDSKVLEGKAKPKKRKRNQDVSPLQATQIDLTNPTMLSHNPQIQSQMVQPNVPNYSMNQTLQRQVQNSSYPVYFRQQPTTVVPPQSLNAPRMYQNPSYYQQRSPNAIPNNQNLYAMQMQQQQLHQQMQQQQQPKQKIPKTTSQSGLNKK